MSVLEKILVVVVLSFFDIIFTVYHIENGLIELNPLMDYLIQEGMAIFILFKTMWTLTILIWLLKICTTDERIKRVSLGLNILIVCYVGVCLYHTYLFLEPSLRGYSAL